MIAADFRTDHLTTDEQRLIAKTVLSVLPKSATGGGCRAFYTPAEWLERGETYGTESRLIVCHDGGALAPFCSYDYGEYKKIDRLVRVLEAAGYWIEQCTSWYSAVYSI